jgi:hypothetical protein
MQRTLERECEELLRKYREIVGLRRAPPDEDPREAMATLAREFPGALREADDLPMSELERRVDQLEGIRRGATFQPTMWMLAISRYHRLTRGALVIKRWLKGRKALDGVEDELRAALPTLPFPGDTCLWANSLAAVARPPAGRLTRLVVERLGGELGIPASEVRALLFSPSGLPLD